MSQTTNVLIYEPTGAQAYGNARQISAIVKFIDRALFKVILAVPDEKQFLRWIVELNGEWRLIRPPAALLGSGADAFLRGVRTKLRVIAAIIVHTKALAVLLRKERIQIVQCHSGRALLTVALAAKLTRTKLLWYVNAHLNNPILDTISFFLADIILFQCETMRNRRYPRLVEWFGSKIRIIRNGIDLELVEQASRANKAALIQELRIDDPVVKIAFLGTLNARKGIDSLVEAFSAVVRAHPNTRLYLVGDSDDNRPEFREYLERIRADVRMNGLADKVVFTGWRPDALEILALADVYVLCGVDEGMPKSIIEAMALGKPVVATGVGGIPEMVQQGTTGFVVPPRNPSSLADAISRLVADQGLRAALGAQARTVAYREFSSKRNIAELQGLYATWRTW